MKSRGQSARDESGVLIKRRGDTRVFSLPCVDSRRQPSVGKELIQITSGTLVLDAPA